MPLLHNTRTNLPLPNVPLKTKAIMISLVTLSHVMTETHKTHISFPSYPPVKGTHGFLSQCLLFLHCCRECSTAHVFLFLSLIQCSVPKNYTPRLQALDSTHETQARPASRSYWWKKACMHAWKTSQHLLRASITKPASRDVHGTKTKSESRAWYWITVEI